MVCNATSAPLPPTPSAVTLSFLKERSTRRGNLYQKRWSFLKTVQQTRNTLCAERSTRMVRIWNTKSNPKRRYFPNETLISLSCKQNFEIFSSWWREDNPWLWSHWVQEPVLHKRPGRVQHLHLHLQGSVHRVLWGYLTQWIPKLYFVNLQNLSPIFYKKSLV